jgi:hypothetical protein
MTRAYLILSILFTVFFQATVAQVKARLIDCAEPRSGFTRLTESLSMPEEDAGFTLLLPEAGKPVAVLVMFHSGRDTSYAGFEQRLYLEAVKRQVAA